eukprot:4682532-Pleurochrysis_carterae.AAC.2
MDPGSHAYLACRRLTRFTSAPPPCAHLTHTLVLCGMASTHSSEAHRNSPFEVLEASASLLRTDAL